MRRRFVYGRACRKCILLNHAPADQMLPDNALETVRCDAAIPDALRINDGDGSLLANAQAVRLRTEDTIAAAVGAKLRQPPFQIIPGFETRLARRALRLRLVCAQEDMAACRTKLELGGYAGEPIQVHAQ